MDCNAFVSVVPLWWLARNIMSFLFHWQPGLPSLYLFAALYAVEVALCLCQAGVLLSLSLSHMWEGWEYFIANLTMDGLQCLRVSGAIVVTGEKYHILPLPLTTWSPISLSLCFIVCCRGSPLPLPLPSRGAPLSLSCGFHN